MVKPIIKIEKMNVITLDVKKVVTHYSEQYIDKNGKDRTRKKKYYTPRIVINFKAEIVEPENCIIVGRGYTDGVNVFIGCNNNTIVNCNTLLQSFSLPTELVNIFSAQYG